MRRILALTACIATLGPLAGLAGATSASNASGTALSTICGQIKNGPYANWVLSSPGQKPLPLKGRTWTVFSTGGIPCATAMAVGRTLLTNYPASVKTLTHLIKPPLKAFDLCSSSPKDGEVSCYDLKHSKNVTLMETGKYTLAQVNQFAATGQLPHIK